MFHSYGFGWRQRKQAAARSKKHRSKKSTQRHLRVGARIQDQETGRVVVGRVFLHDLGPEWVGIFSEEKLSIGARVSLVIEHPRYLYLRAIIVECQLYNLNSRVISAENFKYRVKVKLEYESYLEKEAVTDYCRELSSLPIFEPKLER